MGRREKLIELICARRPPEARFSDIRSLLELEGYELRRQKGSHVTFFKEVKRPLVVPRSNERVKRVYLDDICFALELN